MATADACPACGARVEPVRTEDGEAWECPACHDRFTDEDVEETVNDVLEGD